MLEVALTLNDLRESEADAAVTVKREQPLGSVTVSESVMFPNVVVPPDTEKTQVFDVHDPSISNTHGVVGDNDPIPMLVVSAVKVKESALFEVPNRINVVKVPLLL